MAWWLWVSSAAQGNMKDLNLYSMSVTVGQKSPVKSHFGFILLWNANMELWTAFQKCTVKKTALWKQTFLQSKTRGDLTDVGCDLCRYLFLCCSALLSCPLLAEVEAFNGSYLRRFRLKQNFCLQPNCQSFAQHWRSWWIFMMFIEPPALKAPTCLQIRFLISEFDCSVAQIQSPSYC